MIFSQILVKAGLRASPWIKRGKYCVLPFAESMSYNNKRRVYHTTRSLIQTYPSLSLSARSKCPWRSPAWWGTALSSYCPEVCRAADHKTGGYMYNSSHKCDVKIAFSSASKYNWPLNTSVADSRATAHLLSVWARGWWDLWRELTKHTRPESQTWDQLLIK